ncbi:MAG: RnfABCDGE type electron transport complex subunit B [Eubacteriales bacterium]
MSGFLISILMMVGLALIAAIGLTLAAKFMAVPVDEKEQTLRDVLPGANCGACGFAGCSDYAAALAKGDIAPNLCSAGGASVAAAIGAVLGVDAGEVEEQVAFVACSAKKTEKSRQMDYQGYQTCAGAREFFGGENGCKFGCLGYGDCAAVCTKDAISLCDGLAMVDAVQCMGCGACVKVCPNGVVSMVPKKAKYAVGCQSKEKGKDTRANCQSGCIGCKLCEKACKFEAIQVVDNCAVIDQTKCKNCGACAKACPRHIIRKRLS